MKSLSVLVSLGLLLLMFIEEGKAKLKEGECEVCVKFLTKFSEKLTDEDRKDLSTIVDKLKKACKKAKGKENRFCYYIGGTEDAATYSLNDVCKPLTYFMTPDKICEKLKTKDKQICDLQYEKQIDWKNVNLKKMRVKELKKILSDWGEKCSGCIEKSDFIKEIEEKKHKHIEL